MRSHRLVALAIAGATVIASGVLAQPAPPARHEPGPHGPSHPLAPLGPRGTPDPRPLPLPYVVDDLEAPSLPAAALERAIAPYVYDVRICWERVVRHAGQMRLELVIEHDGRVSRVALAAPRVGAGERARLLACVRKAARGWHFPLRRGATYAVIPFDFERHGGPPPRCPSPRGCPPPEEVRP